MYKLLSAVWVLCAWTMAAQSPPVHSTKPANLSPQDLARGRQLFEGQCAPCHGMQGTGGKGANLAQPTLKHAVNDEALFAVIRNGIENTGMPNAWQMTDREIWLVVAYVRSLGRVAPEKLPGNVEQGKAIYANQGCGGCHMVDGVGGNLGPDLTEVGARRSAARLRQCVLEPGKALPDGFVVVRAVQQDGSTVEGIRINEDSFTIQIRDYANHFHSLQKLELQTLDYQSGSTPMPSYESKLSSQEVDDIVAYLAALRGQS